ncbi:hypothetical protein O3M35_005988 [Rhynocoris fuscipes]|uniref:Uncharacterized protein n=1 Tax=Rhynocoris fuscipes TaxID=488301 RepID=A0AAW1DCA9_9HEMI
MFTIKENKKKRKNSKELDKSHEDKNFSRINNNKQVFIIFKNRNSHLKLPTIK